VEVDRLGRTEFQGVEDPRPRLRPGEDLPAPACETVASQVGPAAAEVGACQVDEIADRLVRPGEPTHPVPDDQGTGAVDDDVEGLLHQM